MGFLVTFVHMQAKLGQENEMNEINEMTLHALQIQDSKFKHWRSEAELSVTEAPRNIESLRVSGEETFLLLWNLNARAGF